MVLSLTQTALAVASGSIVGYSLGLVGGGGSILAVPLLVYVVGLDNPHVAIGTSAIAGCCQSFVGAGLVSAQTQPARQNQGYVS